MKKPLKTIGFILLLVLTILIMGIGISQTAAQYKKINHYQSVEAKILYSKVVAQNEKDENTRYVPKIGYSYKVNGRIFKGDVFTPLYTSGSYVWAKSVSDRYLKGQSCTAYYNPDVPSEAFLERRINFSPYLLILFSLIFVCFIVAAIVPQIILFNRKRNLEIFDDWIELLIPQKIGDNWQTYFYSGLIVFVIGFITLGHYYIVTEKPYHELSYKITAIWLITILVYAFMTIKYFMQYEKYPQIRIFTNKSEFRLGEEIRTMLKVNFNKSSALKQLNFGLVCHEISKYKSGTQNFTQFKPAYAKLYSLCQDHTPKPGESVEFIQKFSIPPDAPISNPSNPKIQWTFQITPVLADDKRNIINVPIEVK